MLPIHQKPAQQTMTTLCIVNQLASYAITQQTPLLIVCNLAGAAVKLAL